MLPPNLAAFFRDRAAGIAVPHRGDQGEHLRCAARVGRRRGLGALLAAKSETKNVCRSGLHSGLCYPAFRDRVNSSSYTSISLSLVSSALELLVERLARSMAGSPSAQNCALKQ